MAVFFPVGRVPGHHPHHDRRGPQLQDRRQGAGQARLAGHLRQGSAGREGRRRTARASLVPVKPGEMVRTETVEPKGLKTRPPARYSEATLLGAMEGAGKLVEDDELREAMQEKGLGTPATRSSIIEGLIAEKYMLREGRELIPTAKAFQLMTLLRGLGVEELSKAELTGEWEYKLAQMEHGKLSRESFMARDRRHDRAHGQEGQGIRPRHHSRRLRHAGHALPELRRRGEGKLPPLRLHAARAGKRRGRAAASRSASRRPAAPSSRPRWSSSCATRRSARWRASAPRRAGRSPPRSSLKFNDEDKNWKLEFDFGDDKQRRRVGRDHRLQQQRIAGRLPEMRRAGVRARQQLRVRKVGADAGPAHAELRLQERQDHPAAAGGTRADRPSCWKPARPICSTSLSSMRTRRAFKAFLAWDKEAGKVNFEFEPRTSKFPPRKTAAGKTPTAREPAAPYGAAAKKTTGKTAAAKKAPAKKTAPAKKAAAPKAPRKTTPGSGLKPSDALAAVIGAEPVARTAGHQEAVGLHQGQRPAGRHQQARHQRRRQAAAGVRQAAGDDVRAGGDCGQTPVLKLP